MLKDRRGQRPAGADHFGLVAVVSSACDEVLMVTALTEAQPVTAGSVISLKSFSDEIADPV